MSKQKLRVHVEIYASVRDFEEDIVLMEYTMDHDDPVQRQALGRRCRDAFEAGQCVVTYPVPDDLFYSAD